MSGRRTLYGQVVQELLVHRQKKAGKVTATVFSAKGHLLVDLSHWCGTGGNLADPAQVKGILQRMSDEGLITVKPGLPSTAPIPRVESITITRKGLAKFAPKRRSRPTRPPEPLPQQTQGPARRRTPFRVSFGDLSGYAPEKQVSYLMESLRSYVDPESETGRFRIGDVIRAHGLDPQRVLPLLTELGLVAYEPDGAYWLIPLE